jgi:hypothetical protein
MLFLKGLILPEKAKNRKSLRTRFWVWFAMCPAKIVSEFKYMEPMRAKKVSEINPIEPILIFAALKL